MIGALAVLALALPSPEQGGQVALQTPDDNSIDLVYTWVNSTDPEWLKGKQSSSSSGPWDADKNFRYRDHDEIRYSLRSVNDFAPWVRRVHVVTCCGQKMSWLKQEHPNLVIVDHNEIMPSELHESVTYNSNAIEAWVHRIPGLSERFLLMNDDFFFGSTTSQSDFFDSSGRPLIAFQEDWGVTQKPDDNADAYVWAAHNTDRLLNSKYVQENRYKVLHQAYPCTKTLFARAHELFGTQLAETTKHQFRDKNDVISFFLASWIGIYEGKAVRLSQQQYPASKYVKLTDNAVNNKQELVTLLAKPGQYKLFCVGDHIQSEGAAKDTNIVLDDFFTGYFPRKSVWEA
jgi:hypothetical protein